MIILGFDYGRRKIGVAISEGPLSEPHSVLHVTNFPDALLKAAKLVEELMAEKIVVGISEAEMGKESHQFGKELEKATKIPVFFQDETLSSWEAQEKSIEAGKKMHTRKKMEDAYAASILLQDFLDNL